MPFLTSTRLAMPWLIAVLAWRGMTFCAILFLAALQTLPAELDEAA